MKSTAQSQEKPGTLEGLEREQTGDALYGDQLPKEPQVIWKARLKHNSQDMVDT